MRKAFSETLLGVADSDPSLVFVTGDLGFQVFDKFESRYPDRYINVGVAECEMINFAAGLAAERFHPIAYSIASFATARPFEQIRYCVAYPNLSVTLVGAGRGLTYSTSGVSHHAMDDIALMTLLPNMSVVIPGDPTEVEQLFPQVMKLNGPAYFTVGRFGEPRFHAEEPAVLGKARLIRKGERIAVVTTGEIVHEAILALEILASNNIHPWLYQFHTLKPLDKQTLDYIADRASAIIVVEEHVPNGGLWSSIAQWKAESNSSTRIVRLGGDDSFALGNFKRETFRKRMGCDATALVNACKALQPRKPTSYVQQTLGHRRHRFIGNRTQTNSRRVPLA